MGPNPLHTEGGSGITWTTVNFGEANPGVQTPLGLTFWLEASEASLVEIGYAVGAYSRHDAQVSWRVDRRHMAGFHGRMAGNVNRFRELADRMPGTSGDAFEEQILGVVQSGERSRPVRRRYAATAVKMPVAGWGVTHEVVRARIESEAWWHRSVRSSPALLDDAVALYAEAYRRFARLMYMHGLITMLAQACFEQVAALADGAGLPGLEAELITGYGGLEETRLLTDLWDVAHGAVSMAGFLDRHGYHGPASGDLISPSWREDPSAVLAGVDAYRAMGATEHPLARQQRQAAIRDAAERRLMSALTLPRRCIAQPLLRLTARFVSQREVGKTAYVQTLDVARAAARAAGRLLADSGALAHAEDVFFLTTEELTTRIPVEARERIAERRTFYEACLRVRISDTWRGSPATMPATEDAAASDSDSTVTGIGVAPGVVTGRVCVVTDPFDDPPIEAGDILVCQTTNPSWIVLFGIAGALVIDIGGALSHGAIAARELGIPCVINTRDGTRRLQAGEIVTVDGSTGVVQRVEPHPIHSASSMGAGNTRGENDESA